MGEHWYTVAERLQSENESLRQENAVLKRLVDDLEREVHIVVHLCCGNVHEIKVFQNLDKADMYYNDLSAEFSKYADPDSQVNELYRDTVKITHMDEWFNQVCLRTQ
jgi:hypothetical protein